MAGQQPPDAVAAAAQSREGGPPAARPSPEPPAEPGEGQTYLIGPRVDRGALARPYERKADDPVYRPLRIWALDPSVSRLDGGIADTQVPYERLTRGFRGKVIEVTSEGLDGQDWGEAAPDHPHVLLRGGYLPSLSDPKFHQQMVYAVAVTTYVNFRLALGRNPTWGFEPQENGRTSLLLRPLGGEEANAWYDRSRGEIVFGYFRAQETTPTAQKDVGYVFTSASHDIISHEMTHALLDGLRSHFLIASHPDVLAFHEAFADLVAFFQHFTFEGFVKAAVARSRGDLSAGMLVRIAREFGKGLGGGEEALRTLIELEEEFPVTRGAAPGSGPVLGYEEAGAAPHRRGQVLARAVVATFLALYQRRTRRYVKLATGGTGKLIDGDLPDALADFLVAEVRKIASQMLQLCIRAIDYCPPVGIRFGDYLRALITADRDLVPDDPWAYRETLIAEFGRRGIFGEGTMHMTEESLAWNEPSIPIPLTVDLSFKSMQFEGDPGLSPEAAELRRQAGALGQVVSRPEFAREFGLVAPGTPEFRAGGYDLPTVESVRSARRVGPDQQVAFDTVAEVVQGRRVRSLDGRAFTFHGGATVILGSRGDVRYIVRKRIDNDQRLAEERTLLDGALRDYWLSDKTRIWPDRGGTRRLCSGRDVPPPGPNRSV